MACRNIEKSEKVHNEIIARTNNPNVHLMQVDVSSLKSINQFCDLFKSRFPQLDILIHNAGYFNHGAKYLKSSDGVEMCFATNVLGPFYMTN